MSRRTTTWTVSVLMGVALSFFAPPKRTYATTAAPSASGGGAQPTEVALSVDELAAHPERYKKPVSVRGVVAYVSEKEHTVVLISEAEFASCGSTSCPEVALPVRWQNALPSVTDRVLVHGQVEKVRKGFLFVARSTEIVERGKNNGR